MASYCAYSALSRCAAGLSLIINHYFFIAI